MHSNNLYLAHHGVPDQKWGLKNGPPYPIKDKAKAIKARKEADEEEKKLNFSKSKAKEAFSNAAIIAMGARMAGQIISGPIGSGIVLGANIIALPDAIIAGVETAKAIGSAVVLKYKDYKADKLENKIEEVDKK